MNLKKYITAAALSIFVSACSPTAAPTIFTPPPKQESAQPKIEQVEKKINEVVKTNIQLDKELDKQKAAAQEQKLEIQEALAQAEKFKLKAESKELITEIEATNLINQLGKVGDRNLFLETSVGSMQETVRKQAAQLETAQEDTKSAKKLAAGKENEADTLRSQNKDYEKEAAKFQKIAKENIDLNAKVKQNGVYKTWFFIALGLLIAYVLITAAMKFYSPFRR